MNADICDADLVLRAKAGEHGAFAALVNKYRHRIMRLALRYSHNHADAEDAVQETFIKAYRAIHDFRGDAAFSSWLHRIAVNTAKTLRAVRARSSSVFTSIGGDVKEGGDDTRVQIDPDTPEDLAMTQEISGALNDALAALSDQQRTAIVLRELQGLSYSAVALEMCCPIGTVRSRVARARDSIDHRLRKVFDHGLGRDKAGRSPAAVPL